MQGLDKLLDHSTSCIFKHWYWQRKWSNTSVFLFCLFGYDILTLCRKSQWVRLSEKHWQGQEKMKGRRGKLAVTAFSLFMNSVLRPTQLSWWLQSINLSWVICSALWEFWIFNRTSVFLSQQVDCYSVDFPASVFGFGATALWSTVFLSTPVLIFFSFYIHSSEFQINRELIKVLHSSSFLQECYVLILCLHKFIELKIKF